MSKKTKAQELQEQLTWSAPHIGKDAPDHKEKAFKYCEGYKHFLNTGKTERECVKEAVHMLKKAGYKPFDRTASYEPGDKVYYVNRKKPLLQLHSVKSHYLKDCGSTEPTLTPQDWI